LLRLCRHRRHQPQNDSFLPQTALQLKFLRDHFKAVPSYRNQIGFGTLWSLLTTTVVVRLATPSVVFAGGSCASIAPKLKLGIRSKESKNKLTVRMKYLEFTS
jgi:hypothetical protein